VGERDGAPRFGISACVTSISIEVGCLALARLAPVREATDVDVITALMRADPHPIRDFFVADLVDYAPKDHPEMMERPFFSISKRKRLKPIEYRSDDGSVLVRATGHPEHGMASIWDCDIIIYCISKSSKRRTAAITISVRRSL